MTLSQADAQRRDDEAERMRWLEAELDRLQQRCEAGRG